MRLFAQTASILFALMLFSFGTAALTRYAVVMPQLREWQAQADRKDLRRVLLAIDAKKQQLAAIAYNHGLADDMYEHTRNHDVRFIENRFPLHTFLNLNIGIVALFDRRGALIDQRGVDLRQGAFNDSSTLAAADLQPYLIDLNKVRPHAPIFDSGLLATRRGALIYAEAPVMRGDADSDTLGTLVVAAPLDADLLRDISEATQLTVRLSPLPTSLPSSEQTLDKIHRDTQDHVFWVLTDNRGHPVQGLELTLPRRDVDTRLMWTPLLMALLVGIFGYFFILALVQLLLLRPIQVISRHLRRVQQQGDYNLRLNSHLGNELGDMSREIDALVGHAQTQQNLLQQQAAEMQLLSYQDSLTGLANRRRFDQALADSWALAQRSQTSLALLMCDVDYFKSFNDHYGHQYGDEVLKHVAEIIRRAVVRHSDLAARYGGEEFAVLLPDTTEAGALRIAERLQEELRGAAIAHSLSPIDNLLTISIGAASLVPNALLAPRELVRRADEALYSSKANGRNRVTPASTLS